MSQRQPDAADPEVGVHLGGSRQELQWLVAADIQGAQRDSAPVERFGDLAVDRELLLDVRRVLASQEQKLGAHQAHEIRTVGACRPGVVHRSDVGAHRNRDTVAGDRRLGGAGARLALALREGGDAGLKLLDERPRADRRRILLDRHRRRRWCLREWTARSVRHRRRREYPSPAKNNVVGVRAAEGQQNRGDTCGVELGGLGRGQVGGDQHTGRTARTLAGAEHRPQDLIAYRADIVGPRLQVGIRQRRRTPRPSPARRTTTPTPPTARHRCGCRTPSSSAASSSSS